MRFTFAPARNVSFAAGTTALSAIFVGALWMQFHLGFPWFFRIVTALVDLLLLSIVIDLWLGATVVVAGNGVAGGADARVDWVEGIRRRAA